MSPVEAATQDLQSQASVAVAAKALDNTRLEGELANQLIQIAAEPPQAPPPSDGVRGTRVNVYA